MERILNHDVVIVGAGPAGLSFARSLADSGLRIAVIEKQSEDELDEKELAHVDLSGNAS